VSNGFLADSPGQILAQRYSQEGNVRKIAFNGSPAVKTLAVTNGESFADRTAVIAVDLFFWDSVQQNAEHSLKVMRRLFAEVRARNIPLVVGDIPQILPAFQPQAALLNHELRSLCERSRNCSILPLDQMAKDLLHNRFLEIHGTRYSLQQLLPDGLHISAIASNHLADQIAKRL
jgi:hypothetical protein